MTLLFRASNGAPRVLLTSLTRPSPRGTRTLPFPAPRTPPRPRFSSTTTPPAPPPPPSPPPTSRPSDEQQTHPPHPPQPKPRRSLRPLIFATLFLAAGLLTGNIIRFTIAPPPLPDPGTEMDEALSDKLRAELDALAVVRDYEARAAAASSSSSDGGEGWEEVAPWGELGPRTRSRRRDSGVEGWKGWFRGWFGGGGGGGGRGGEDEGSVVEELFAGLDDEKHVVSQTLAAMKAFGPARRFVNTRTRESVTVFWIGGGLSGWPGVAHGGALAMAFVESFGSPEQKRTAAPAKLTLTYLAPTMASNFFILKAAPSPSPAPTTELPPQKDMTKRPVPGEERPADGGEEWSGTLQAVQGRMCVKATAVLPR